MNWADYGACFYYTLLPFLLAINYFGRWWSQKLLEVTTFKYSLFSPWKTNCVVFYPKNCIFTFVVEKKVWKLETLSILIEFSTFLWWTFHTPTTCHYQLLLTPTEAKPGSGLSSGSLGGGGHSARLWHAHLARHPGQMSDSYSRNTANQKGTLVWTLAPLSVSEMLGSRAWSIDKTSLKMALVLIVK